MYDDDKLKFGLYELVSKSTKVWSWIKKEVGDYDPSLMEKLQYYNPK